MPALAAASTARRRNRRQGLLPVQHWLHLERLRHWPLKMAQQTKTSPATRQVLQSQNPVYKLPGQYPPTRHPHPLRCVGPCAACEDRMLLGFQTCMSEQCAKPAFINHAICVERQGMDKRRREDQRNRQQIFCYIFNSYLHPY